MKDRRETVRVIAAAGLLLSVVIGGCQVISAQTCCTTGPSGESTVPTGENSQNWSATDFKMTLSGGSGNFGGWTLQEYTAKPGGDGCYYSGVNTAYVPEYPGVTGNSGYVAGDNTWQDEVGWTPASVQYILDNSPYYSNHPIILVIPCGADVYQAVSVECPGGKVPDLFDPDVTQTETVYRYNVRNSREGVYGAYQSPP